MINVENYIRSLPWSDCATDAEKTLVAGNLRNFAHSFDGVEEAMRAALAYIAEPSGMTPELIRDKAAFHAHMECVEREKVRTIELLRAALNQPSAAGE